MRTLPSNSCGDSLAEFDRQQRLALDAIMGQTMDDDEWGRASRGVRFAGLGFRECVPHAPGAYWSSMLDCEALVRAIWPQADIDSAISSQEDNLGVWCSREIRDRVREGLTRRQKTLSDALDRYTLDAECANLRTASHMSAHLRLASQDGAGQWLTAPPNADNGTLLDGELFRVAAKRRIRMRFREAPGACCLCGQALDSFSDHALVCPCGGDRTVRHNIVQCTLTNSLRLEGLSPIPEKPGLLPVRPGHEGNAGRERTGGIGTRRPADVWIPSWQNGRGAAVDIAITSGLAGSWLQRVLRDPAGPTVVYEEFKREDRDTAVQCAAQGFDLVPFIMEAHSGCLGADATALCQKLGRKYASRTGTDPGTAISELVTRIQISLQMETARAILRRLGSVMEGFTMETE